MAGDPAPWPRALFPWTIVAAEIGTALLALVPRTRTCISDEFLLILERRRFTPDDLRQVILRCPVDAEAPAGETPQTRL